MPTTKLLFWDKIRVLTWKNWISVWNRRKRVIAQVVTPSIFLLILIALRFLVQVEHVNLTFYSLVDLEEKWKWLLDKVASNQEKINKHGIFLHNCFLPKLIVAYAPNNSVYTELMTSASKNYLNNIELMGFESGWEVRWYMQREHFLAGVIFNHTEHITHQTVEDMLGKNFYDFDYSLLFPSELRFLTGSFITLDWTTDKEFAPYTDFYNIDYLKEGFISLQNAISMTFIKAVLKQKNVPTIKMNSFPRKEHLEDPLMKKFSYTLPLIILIGYLGPYTQFTKRIIREREFFLRDILKVHGITQIIHFLTWFTRGFVLSLFGAIFVLVVLKIRWCNGFGICTYSSWTALYFIIVCYNVACTTFCYMIASMTSKSSLGVAFLGVTWFLTFMPYLGSQTQVKPGPGTKIAICMFSNSVMGWAFNEIIELEYQRRGLHWQKFFTKAHNESFISVGMTSIILLVFSGIYALLGILMNDIYRLSSVFFRAWFQMINLRSSRGSLESNSKISLRKSQIFQIENAGKKVCVEIKNLTKVFQEEVAIDNISLGIYQGEITVVMGHNACGKTILLSMLAGVIMPTSGTVLYEGIDIFKSVHYGLNIGISLQNNLFPDLTVVNMIVFYCRLKGVMDIEMSDEVQKYLRAMNLLSVENVLVRNLTASQKRHLSVCCALCGYSKYVVLDEPSAGLDTMTRRKFWALLTKEKVNRAIIITTQSTEEAEVLGDRLVILSKGELRCYGSTYFLKAIYGKGYRLVCLKDPNCDTNEVNNFLRNYIANINPESDLGMELTYRLKERHALVFAKLLSDLEDAFVHLRINGCTISEPIVEDIFLCMGAEDPSNDDQNRHSELMNGFSIYVEEYEKLSFVKKHRPYKGFKLFRYHIQSVLLKRYACNKRECIAILQYIVPILVTLLTYLMADSQIGGRDLKPKVFRLSHYPETVSVLSEPNEEISEALRERIIVFKQYFSELNSHGLGHKHESTENYTMEEFMLMKQRKIEEFDAKYLIGVSYTEEYIIAWYNNFVPHTAPLSLNTVHNGILLSGAYKGQINVRLEPLPFELKNGVFLYVNKAEMQFTENFHHFLAFNLTYTICFSYGFILMYLIHERVTRFKLLQFICGLRHFAFYLGGMIYDLSKFVIISFTVFLGIILFKHSQYEHFVAAGCYLLVLSVFGVCVIPFYYLASLIFADALSGYVILTSFTVYGVAAFSTLGKVDAMSSDEPLPMTLSWISYIFPHYPLCTSLIKIFKIMSTREICSSEEHKIISKLVDECVTKPNCCIEPQEFAWNDEGVLVEIGYFFIYGTLCMILVFIIEFRTILKRFLGFTVPAFNIDLARDEYDRTHTNSEMIEDDLLIEKMRVERLPKDEYRYKPLITSNIGKIYGNKVAVHQISIVMERRECLGILGANGAGKSTILKMLVGDEKLTCGRAYVKGISLTEDLHKMYKHIGYCPHIDAVPEYMTCSELLRYLCGLRGIPIKHITNTCLCLVKVFGIVKHYNKQIYYITPGIKRRLSTAISMIGSPSIIYLDEHTVGIDLAGRRQIWNVIGRLCKLGKAVLITTQNTNECERFCTRLGFIYNGRWLCLDSVYNLQKRFVKDYLLQVKVKVVIRPPSFLESGNVSLLSLSSNPFWNPFMKVMEFVEGEYPNSSISDHRGAIITFLIPAEENSISQIYKKLHRHAFSLNIESFSIIHESLALVFTDIAEKNKFF